MTTSSPSQKHETEPEHLLTDTIILMEIMRTTLANGNTFRFRATGDSMWPFIRSGDTLTLYPIRAPQPRLGEVVAFIHQVDGRLLVHRVIQKSKNGFRIKGDHRYKPDGGWISAGELLGYVTRVERGNREIHLGLGWERVFIAFFSRLGWHVPVVNLLRAVKARFT